MTTVYKYPLPIGDLVTLLLPKGAEALHVDVQAGKPMIWARVNPDEPLVEERRFRFAGTGHPLDARVGRHVGSFMLHGGSLVFHIFEEATDVG